MPPGSGSSIASRIETRIRKNPGKSGCTPTKPSTKCSSSNRSAHPNSDKPNALIKAGLPVLKSAVASNWFRGAVTGLGILNLFIAFWEMAHFTESVDKLEGKEVSKKSGER